MTDKKNFIFPSLLFAIFFFLIVATGFLQLRIIKNNVEGILKGEAEIVYNHIKREIDINFEYVDLLEKSPAIVTPNFLDIMISDEAVVEDLYNLMSVTEISTISNLPLKNYTVFDTKGSIIAQKGDPKVSHAELRPLIAKKQETILKMPTSKDKSLFMGMRIRDLIFFFKIDDQEMDFLRKKSVLQDILDREEKQFNVVGIHISDEKGMPFIARNSEPIDAFVLSRPLDSQFLPGYTIEIFISKALAGDTLKKTTMSFVFILVLLVLSGALGTFAIFTLERKHEKKMNEMEKELELKERLVSLGKLASGMAHEIRNPLNAISLSVQRLKREFLPEEEKKEEYLTFLNIMRSELIRVDRIVEEFLLSTRAHAPFMNENLYDIFDEVLTIISEKAVSREITLVNKIDKQIIIESQKDRLKQAFYNIILNAIEAIDQRGSVEIWMKRKDNALDVFIKDSGCGIKEEELHKIFEYHYTTKDKGMGLGVPISYMIIKDHGGDIRVESEEGRGTIFIITLPVKQKTITNNQITNAKKGEENA
jgi:nitrogen-specific signal transduction histidine kinase